MALEKNKDVCDQIKKSNYEVACHGWRWIDYQNIPKMTEKKHMLPSNKINKKNIRKKAFGGGTREDAAQILCNLVIEEGGFLYMIAIPIVTIYPIGRVRGKKKQLIIPYTLDNNDMRFATSQGFN